MTSKSQHLLISFLMVFITECGGQYHRSAYKTKSTRTSLLTNRIIGTPSVQCMEDVVNLDYSTEAPFTGNIFVKGKSRDPSCTKSFSKLALTRTSYSLSLGRCGMQRLRTASPRGMSFTITLIISFHPIFLTKGDRAYHVKCFYMEPDEVVSASLDVSMMATNSLSDRLRMPTCEYTVRRDSPNGAIVSFANIGETVYHVWECKGPDMGILVKKCFVNDGRGDEVEVIDYDGCVVDELLIADIQYDSTLMRAHAHSHVFRYQDASELFFTCQIRMCQKSLGLCQGITPPRCSTIDRLAPVRSKLGENNHHHEYNHDKKEEDDEREKRHILTAARVEEDENMQELIDVISSEITVMGLDNNINASKAESMSIRDNQLEVVGGESKCVSVGWVTALIILSLSTLVVLCVLLMCIFKSSTLTRWAKSSLLTKSPEL